MTEDKARRIAELKNPGFKAIERYVYKGMYIFNLTTPELLKKGEPMCDPLLVSVDSKGVCKPFSVYFDLDGFMEAAEKTRKKL